ncbi:nuclear transport factor 2 family protein [Kitasatospora sp. NPDC096077]|uniref:nuclear transport factor 2 family protein n=1 Tax=Kitasatospora sp. NPDC096077 TaxID=3155544 RepID=UPI00332B776F
MSTERTAGTEQVRTYYKLVDAQDVEGLIALFAPDAVYRRPGYDPMRGHDGLRVFYTGQRVIESGRHTITSLTAQDDRVTVSGVFEGRLRDGKDVSLEFADFFTLTPEGLFQRRDTFFFAPLV